MASSSQRNLQSPHSDDSQVTNVDDEDLLIREELSGNENQSLTQRPSLLPQYFAAFSACWGALSMGSILGYASPAGPLLTNGTDTKIHLTIEENGYFGSIAMVGALCGGPLAGLTIGSYGRKPTMVFSVIPFILGWALIAGAQDYAMLMIGRIITGLCCGITSLTVPTYIGEFSSPNIRGTLSTGFQVFVTIGVLYSYLFAPIVDSFRLIAIGCGIPSLIYFAFIIFCKESPTFLLIKNKNEEARKALEYFRGKNYNINQEIETLKADIDESRRNKKTFKDLISPHILKPLLISIALMFFQQFSGINALLFNLGFIFKAGGSEVPEDIAAIIIGATQVVSTVASALIIDRLGRKLLLIISGSIMAISLAALGFFFFELECNQDLASHITWLPLVSLSLYIIAFSLGFGPIPWVFMGEVFSSDIREMAASIATCCNWSFAFIVTIIYQPLTGAIHLYGVYWLFSIVCFINVLFTIFVVIETNGKSIEEIAAIFGGFSHSRMRESSSIDGDSEVSYLISSTN